MALVNEKLKSVASSSTDIENPTPTLKMNPLDISGVVRTICGFLSQDDIKQCRIVSKEWNSTAKIVLAHRSKITPFRHFPFSFSNLQEIFSGSLNYQLITTVEFSYTSLCPQRVSELTNFFRSHKTMADLSLGFLTFVDENEKPLETFDITPWIEQSQLKNPNCNRNTKLCLQAEKDDSTSTTMQVSLCALIHVKEIILEKCEVGVIETKSEKLKPIKICLKDVKFSKDGLLFPNFPIKDFLDLSRAEDLKLTINEDQGEKPFATTILLDLYWKEEVILQDVELRNIKIKNWRACTWTIKSLQIMGVPFPFKYRNGMQITRLTYSGSAIDLCLLPQSIEYLQLSVREDTNVFCSKPLALPRLQDMALYFSANLDASFLLHFENCQNLKKLFLESCTSKKLDLNFSWIPKSVKEMELLNVNLPGVWQGVNSDLKLEKMELHSYTFKEAMNIYNTGIPIQELILQSMTLASEDPEATFQVFFEHQRSCDSVGHFVVGPFRWTQTEFANSFISNYVDKQARFYRFENGRGVAVNGEDYDMYDMPESFYDLFMFI